MGANDVIRPAASLVVRDEQRGRVPLFAMHHRLSNLALEPRTIFWAVGWMLGEIRRGHDVRDLGKVAILGIFKEAVDSRECNRTCSELRLVAGSDRVLFEGIQQVAAEVVKVLVHAPRNTSVLKVLWERFPMKRTAGILANGVALHATGNIVVVDNSTT